MPERTDDCAASQYSDSLSGSTSFGRRSSNRSVARRDSQRRWRRRYSNTPLRIVVTASHPTGWRMLYQTRREPITVNSTNAATPRIIVCPANCLLGCVRARERNPSPFRHLQFHEHEAAERCNRRAVDCARTQHRPLHGKKDRQGQHNSQEHQRAYDRAQFLGARSLVFGQTENPVRSKLDGKDERGAQRNIHREHQRKGRPDDCSNQRLIIV